MNMTMAEWCIKCYSIEIESYFGCSCVKIYSALEEWRGESFFVSSLLWGYFWPPKTIPAAANSTLQYVGPGPTRPRISANNSTANNTTRNFAVQRKNSNTKRSLTWKLRSFLYFKRWRRRQAGPGCKKKLNHLIVIPLVKKNTNGHAF